MNVYIVEIDSLDEINESTVRILSSVDDPALCSVYTAKTSKERQLARIIHKKWQCINQHIVS